MGMGTMTGFNLEKEIIKLSDREYQLLADLIYEKSGIHLGTNKKELVKARLMKRLKFYQLGTFREYYSLISQDQYANEVVEMIDAISTNVTSFFREKQHFDFLERSVYGPMIAEKKRRRSARIRIWSAACSTGEEPYSIMMSLLEHVGSTSGWDIKLLGTDISTKVLAIAQQGIYTPQKLETMPPLLKTKYFRKIQEDRENYYAISDQVKGFVTLARLNLMDQHFPFRGKFDFIFCRNVMIYFDRPTQEKLVNKLSLFLEPGGYLFIGHSESLAGLAKDTLEPVAPAILKRI